MAYQIKDVARLAGVSSTTVSHVINGTRHVAEETKAKVHAAMQELNYMPNSLARSLRTNNSKTVALLVPDITNYFFAKLIEEVETYLGQYGYKLFLCNSHENPELERRHLATMNAQQVTGVILAPTRSDVDYRDFFQDRAYPLVFVDRRTAALQADTVVVDGCEAIGGAVAALAGKGYRKIAYISGQTDISTTTERFQGYKRGLSANGMKFSRRLALFAASSPKSGYALTAELLGIKGVDAVIVANNPMVIGALKCLADRGVRIPDDMAVIGFEDYDWADITVPPLSTIRQPVPELGLLAAQLLLRRINRTGGAETELHELKAELVVRGSF